MNVRVFNHSAIILRLKWCTSHFELTFSARTFGTIFLKHTFLFKCFCLWSKARWICRFLGSFTKLRKATISFFIMSVCPSVRIEQLGSHWTDFHEIWCSRIFQNHREKIRVSLQSDKNNGYFTRRTIYIFLSYLAQLFLEWEMFQTKVIQKIKTHFVFNNFSWNIVPFMR